jgi:hypothetical protein
MRIALPTLMKRKRSLVVLAVVAGAAIAGAGVAYAWPYGCSTNFQSHKAGAYFQCNNGTGSYAISIQCAGDFGWYPFFRYWSGSLWKSAPSTTWAWCNDGIFDGTTGSYNLWKSN